MAIDRLRSPYTSSIIVNELGAGPSAYASAWNGSTGGAYTFIGDGTAGTIVGVTYRCHLFEVQGSMTQNITFNRSGVIDLLLLGGGGAGGAARQEPGGWHSTAGGGGGAGGLILSYNYGVTATTYAITVGVGGASPGWDGGGQDTGGNSIFGSLTAFGGGDGGTREYASNGGSGGGSSVGRYQANESKYYSATKGLSSAAGQGNAGGAAVQAWNYSGGGGGGFTSAGEDGNFGGGRDGGDGGNGITLRFDGITRTIAAGGGGGAGWSFGSGGNGGSGVGGTGAGNNSAGGNAASNGCGGGGASVGASNSIFAGGAGSPGLCIVRYAIG